MGLVRGFRANIIATFGITLFLAMALILLVVTSYYRKQRLTQIEEIALVMSRQMVPAILTMMTAPASGPSPTSLMPAFGRVKGMPLKNLYVLKKDGDLMAYRKGDSDRFFQRIRIELIAATLEKEIRFKPLGSQWVFPGRIPRFLLVSQPLDSSSRAKTAGLLVDLAPVKAEIVKLNNLMLSYFMVNLVVFALIGAYRLNRIYMRPIQRMVKRADDFREEDALLFTARSGDDEINRLSKSLNLLLRRISEDKRQLQQTVAELEVANANLKQAQNEVVRAETLASVGRLASGVAHEIGNPIGIVLGYLDLLTSQNVSADDRKDYLDRIEAEVQRINGIIRQLLDLSRPTDSQTDLIQLHGILEDTVAIVRPQPLMKQLTIETRLTAEHDSVLAAPEQLRQVFLNLLLNAADAITATGTENGKIVIHSQLVSGGKTEMETTVDYIEVLFEDNGPGIPPEHQGHIFEPFFTTKEPGKGTGLGLSVSFMIIENLKGQLSAEAMASGGTRMRIRLPLFAGETTASPEGKGRYDRDG